MSSPFNPLSALQPPPQPTPPAQPKTPGAAAASTSTPGAQAAPPPPPASQAQAQAQSQPQQQQQQQPSTSTNSATAPGPAAAAAPPTGSASLPTLPLPTTASPITGSPGHPFLSPSGAGLAGLGAFAGLPGMGSIPALTSIAGGGGLGVMAGQGGMSGLSSGQRWGAAEVEKEATGADLDDALRMLPDISRLLERAEGLLRSEGDVFGVVEGRVDSVQLEYAQTLLALISLTSSYLVGALPVPLSSAAGFTAPAPKRPSVDDKAAQAAPGTAAPSGAASTATSTVGGANSTAQPAAASGTPAAPASATLPPSGISLMPSLVELTAWTEARAQTQFARRESVRIAAKNVGDVLRGSGVGTTR